jgi:hypothetical protein
MVRWGHSQVIKSVRCVQHFQLSLRRSRHGLKLANELVAEERLGLLVVE